MSSSPRWRRVIRRMSLVFVGVVLVGAVTSWIVAGRLIAARPFSINVSPPGLVTTSITLASESGSRIAGWHVVAPGRRGVVVLLHPIRGSRLTMVDRARMLHARGYSIVMVDLQAIGESRGDHITLGHLERHDARAAVEFARREHPGEKIGLIGVSLGGAAALLGSPLGIDGLILESVFPDVERAIGNRVAAKLRPLSRPAAGILLFQLEHRFGLQREDLRPIDHVSDAGCAILVISGNDDYQTTPAETKELFDRARQPKDLWMIDGAGHEDLFRVTPEEYEIRVARFLERHLRGS